MLYNIMRFLLFIIRFEQKSNTKYNTRNVMMLDFQ